MAGQQFVPHIFFGLDAMMVSTVILCITYAVIIWDKLNRAIAALLGASVMVVIGALDQNEALKGIDWNTIGLLTGMMILVSVSRRSGMFEYLAIWSAQKVKANPAGILLMLQLTTAVASSLLDNVTTVLLVVPVTLAITRELDVPPYPFLFAEVFASNIGGTATLIGDPPNIMIGSLVGLDFNAFIIHLTPVIIVVMAAQALMIHLVWGKALKSTPARQALVMGMSAKETILDWTLLKQSLVVLTAVIVAFVRGVEVGGLLHLLANELVAATGGNMATAGYSILWASAFLSAIVDNIPFVATMIPLIKSMAPAYGGADKIEPLWWCLSLGACLGGNGTLIGASANLTVAGIAERSGIPFRFVTYAFYGMPMMVVSIAICHVYVWWRYF